MTILPPSLLGAPDSCVSVAFYATRGGKTLDAILTKQAFNNSLERETRLELATSTLARLRSTN